MKKSFLLLFIISFLSLSNFVFAQIQTSTNPTTGIPVGINEQVSVEMIPKIPAPGEQVRISIDSFSTDLNKANFTWRINGATERQERGLRVFNFFAPESGESMTVSVTIQKEDGGTLSESFTIAPADVDLIYEANTYAHPYYKGKTLFTSEAEIRFVAIPNFIINGQKAPAENLVYTWKINGNVIQGVSGYGRQVFETQGGLIDRAATISVEVSAVNSNLQAKNSIAVSQSRPEVIFYENNPLLGIVFEKATFGSFVLERPEVELQAIPYFFSTPQKNNSFLQYSWRLNNNAPDESQVGSSIRFRNTTGETGRSIVSLSVEHLKNILQGAKTDIELNFEESNVFTENEFEF